MALTASVHACASFAEKDCSIHEMACEFTVSRRHISSADVISHLQTSYPICRRHIPSAEVLSHEWFTTCVVCADGEADFRSALTMPPEDERLREGRLWLGQRPGLGVELNPQTVEMHRAPVALPRASL